MGQASIIDQLGTLRAPLAWDTMKVVQPQERKNGRLEPGERWPITAYSYVTVQDINVHLGWRRGEFR
jgi:hypothetical protein